MTRCWDKQYREWPTLSCRLKACNVFFPYRILHEAYCDFANVDDWLTGMLLLSISVLELRTFSYDLHQGFNTSIMGRFSIHMRSVAESIKDIVQHGSKKVGGNI